MDIHIVANAALGAHLSGGDRIFIECARRWAEKGHRVIVYVWEEGLEMCRRNRLEGVEFVLWPASGSRRFGFAVNYLGRTLRGISAALRASPAPDASVERVVYSASDFWPDSIPAFILSRRLKAGWIAGFYLFAPDPLKGYKGALSGKMGLPAAKGLLYYLHQRPVFSLIKKRARAVFVTCDEDREAFVRSGRPPGDIVAVRGGVHATRALKERNPAAGKRYDACFVGRFHPQKGLMELMDIWGHVLEKRPGSKLAVIGAGPDRYSRRVREYAASRGLGPAVDFMGFMDGDEKHRIFEASRAIVHPAVYDSGGMAACEGMAWGLPAVGFDLPALRSYYPRGMLKAPPGRCDIFAELILKLLEDGALYERTRDEALSLAGEWDWEKRADELLSYIEKSSLKGC